MEEVVFNKKLFMVESTIKNSIHRNDDGTVLYNYEQFREIYICPCGCANIIRKIGKGQDREGKGITNIEEPVLYPIDLFDRKKKCSCNFYGVLKDLDAKSFVVQNEDENNEK